MLKDAWQRLAEQRPPKTSVAVAAETEDLWLCRVRGGETKLLLSWR